MMLICHVRGLCSVTVPVIGRKCKCSPLCMCVEVGRVRNVIQKLLLSVKFGRVSSMGLRIPFIPCHLGSI